MKKKVHRFELFRYQLLPIDRFFQGDLFGEIKSIDDLLLKKNDLFIKVIESKSKLNDGKISILAKKIYEVNNFYLYKYAVNRSITRETEKFTEEELENWPSFYIGIWNDQHQQLLLIEERFEAFQHTETVVTTIQKIFNDSLKNVHVRMHVEALFYVEDFWKIIERHKGEINQIDFELITPNMANISSALNDDLKDLAKTTNTSTTNIIVTADKDSALNIEPSNEQLSGLVKYSSDGGGNIKIRAIGIKRKIQTSQTKKSIEIDELEMSSSSPGEIAALMQRLLT